MTIEKRNAAIWQDYTDFAYRGIKNTLESHEETINLLGEASVLGDIYIVNDKNRIKVAQLDDVIQLGRDQILNEQAITDSKAETQRTIMALKSVTNDYVLTVVRYAANVKGQISDARLLAIEMGENEVALAGQRAVLSDEKADIKIQEIDMRVQLEGIERQHVEIEKLRAELSVAKANTTLIMANIDVKRAELSVIKGQVEKAMAEISKVELTVQVAMTLADLVVRQIAGVRLESERADLAAIADVIGIKLTAALALIDQKIGNVREKTEDERETLESLRDLQVAKLDEQQIWLEQAASNADIHDYKEIANDEFLSSLRDLEELVSSWAIKYIKESNQNQDEIYRQNARDSALTLRAQADGYMKKTTRSYTNAITAQHIVKGSASLLSSGCSGLGGWPHVPSHEDEDEPWEVNI
jgi:hypothetical protein